MRKLITAQIGSHEQNVWVATKISKAVEGSIVILSPTSGTDSAEFLWRSTDAELLILTKSLDSDLEQASDRSRVINLIKANRDFVDTIIVMTATRRATQRFPNYYAVNEITPPPGIRFGMRPITMRNTAHCVVLDISTGMQRTI